MRAVLGNDTSYSFAVLAADDETLVDAASPPLVTITRADGTAVTSGVASTHDSTGIYHFDLLAATHTSRLDCLTLSWTATVAGKAVKRTDTIKVVAGRFFTLAQLRAKQGLAGQELAYPNAALADARDIAEDFVEEFCKDAFIEQARRDTFDGDGSMEIFLPRVNVTGLISCKVDGVVQTITGWTVSSAGHLRALSAAFNYNIVGQNVIVEYSVGHKSVPFDLRNATVELARHLLLTNTSSIPDRARMMQTEFAMYQLDVASEDKPTGVPNIDAVLIRYRELQPDFLGIA